ncbi:chloride channel protein [Magnetospirillum sp. 15-1]|uniref:chloride channel protein n=1 Tax=Magnetospirillum sp. 15-1 TaxID=1979370 RepID=UPI001F5B6DDC|nr:chloride channel protein [Magnetospirillum sp. 15-1]
MIRYPKFSLKIWLHRMLFWGGAVLVALAAMLFERTSTLGNHLFSQAIAIHPALAFVITPLGLVGVLWLTRRVFPGAQGSGIPQTIAAMKLPVLADRNSVLSLRLAAGKVLLTSLGLCVGASVGREGPTVQIGAAIMHALGRWIRLPIQEIDRTLILAGGAAGIAAAFNTPLAGIVFAIEELSRSFEERTSGTVLTTVIVSGVTAMAVVGNYTYFGRTDAVLDLAAAWRPVLICGICGGLLGGLFARILIAVTLGLPGRAGQWVKDHPFVFASLCGLGMAVLGMSSGNSIYGTGYEEAKGLIEGKSELSASFGLMKLAATMLSYVSGIPGGVFAPSLAVGAGLGANLVPWLPGAPIGALAILGMVGYFTGVVQAPITAVVIVMEMTSSQSLTLPLMAAAVIAYGVSRLVCPNPMYRTLAEAFIERGIRREPRMDRV